MQQPAMIVELHREESDIMGIRQIDSESNVHLEPTVLTMQQVVIHEHLDTISQVLFYTIEIFYINDKAEQ